MKSDEQIESPKKEAREMARKSGIAKNRFR